MEHIDKAIEELSKMNYSKKELDTFRKSFVSIEDFYKFLASKNSLIVSEVKIMVSHYVNEYLIEYKKNSIRPIDTKGIVEKTAIAYAEVAAINNYDKKKIENLKTSVSKITSLSYQN
jgi:hypothetical protein